MINNQLQKTRSQYAYAFHKITKIDDSKPITRENLAGYSHKPKQTLVK